MLPNGERQAEQGEQRKALQGIKREALGLSKRDEPDSSNDSRKEREAARRNDGGDQRSNAADAVKKSQKTFHVVRYSIWTFVPLGDAI